MECSSFQTDVSNVEKFSSQITSPEEPPVVVEVVVVAWVVVVVAAVVVVVAAVVVVVAALVAVVAAVVAVVAAVVALVVGRDVGFVVGLVVGVVVALLVGFVVALVVTVTDGRVPAVVADVEPRVVRVGLAPLVSRAVEVVPRWPVVAPEGRFVTDGAAVVAPLVDCSLPFAVVDAFPDPVVPLAPDATVVRSAASAAPSSAPEVEVSALAAVDGVAGFNGSPSSPNGMASPTEAPLGFPKTVLSGEPAISCSASSPTRAAVVSPSSADR